MDVVSTMERLVRGAGLFRSLDLNAVVVQVVLLPQDGVGLGENALLLSVKSWLEDDVASEWVFVIGERPNMYVVNFLHAVDALKTRPDLVNFQMGRGSLEDKDNALPESQAGGPQNDNGKEVGADRVDVPQVGPEEDYRSCNDDTYRVQKVTKDVQESSFDIKVFLNFVNWYFAIGVVVNKVTLSVMIVSMVVLMVMRMVMLMIVLMIVGMGVSMIVFVLVSVRDFVRDVVAMVVAMIVASVIVAMDVASVIVFVIVVGVSVSDFTVSVTGAFLTTSVDVTALTGVEDLDLNQVKEERQASDWHHDGTTDLRRVEEAPGSFVD
jgi:hypothetical protein